MGARRRSRSRSGWGCLMLPETSIIEAPEATTAPVATSWHYWVAFLHSRGFGAAAVALSGPITAASR